MTEVPSRGELLLVEPATNTVPSGDTATPVIWSTFEPMNGTTHVHAPVGSSLTMNASTAVCCDAACCAQPKSMSEPTISPTMMMFPTGSTATAYGTSAPAPPNDCASNTVPG